MDLIARVLVFDIKVVGHGSQTMGCGSLGSLGLICLLCWL